MFEAVEKLKTGEVLINLTLNQTGMVFCFSDIVFVLAGAVLIVLGFMSLILSATQGLISKICIPNKVANTMLPCRQTAQPKTTQTLQGRRLAKSDDTSGSSDYCASKVKS